MNNAISLEGVSKSFRNVLAVDDLNLAVPRGSVYGFIGPNGSGKTTTLRMILRILYPDQGRVVVLGNDHGDAADDRVGYLPEERGLYKKMRVTEVLRYFASLKGMRDSRAEIAKWLERFNLGNWAKSRVEALSKGMAQKTQFIAAVIAKPELVILDEPFSGLDPVNRDVLKDAVLDLRKQGTTIVFSTHDMKVAEQLCDTIFMIYRGKKVLDGTLDAIQAEFGEDTLLVRTPAGADVCAGLPGVLNVNDMGREKEIRIERSADPQQVLQALVSRAAVERFEIVRPSLHDIFVRIARPATEESHAHV